MGPTSLPSPTYIISEVREVSGEAPPIQKAQGQAGSLSEGLRLSVEVVGGVCWAYRGSSYSAPGYCHYSGT